MRKEMLGLRKLIFGSRRRGKFLVKLILFCVFIYVVALLINQRMTIREKQNKINEMKEQISVQEVKVGELRSELDAINSLDSKCLEDIAHKDLKLSKKGERVFVNIKGN